jgi:RimJ/RimL family protein N-acetyltransferase
LGCLAVEIRTHSRNDQSRAAIERLGAKLDGILRRHMIMPDGHIRDTAVYSILQEEWPEVKARLEQRLASF